MVLSKRVITPAILVLRDDLVLWGRLSASLPQPPHELELKPRLHCAYSWVHVCEIAGLRDCGVGGCSADGIACTELHCAVRNLGSKTTQKRAAVVASSDADMYAISQTSLKNLNLFAYFPWLRSRWPWWRTCGNFFKASWCRLISALHAIFICRLSMDRCWCSEVLWGPVVQPARFGIPSPDFWMPFS